MPNHVHLLAVPDGQDGLRALLGEVHRRYTAGINARNGWTGHLWQGRFGSVVMDEDHLVHDVRYVCLNPVRAKLVTRAEDWPWASTRAHLSGRDDGLTDLTPVRERFATFADVLDSGEDQAAVAALRRSERTGRPLGSAVWPAGLEATTGRVLARRKPGPRPESRNPRTPPEVLRIRIGLRSHAPREVVRPRALRR
ncbi:transposase [Labrys wisconsinensis]|uniref:Transposase n=1 Tax=Labrys wisconsinensis TaxID=425677 RepID=A0ABU0JI36_9HYPH|nr:transposase [Labrys wisconsinensis]MDQ0473265.1 putative transposase [Labrys wisconsinensis]